MRSRVHHPRVIRITQIGKFTPLKPFGDTTFCSRYFPIIKCECYIIIGHFGKYHNTLCLSPQILHKHCFQFLLGLTMVPRENKNNAYVKLGGGGGRKQRILWYFPKWPMRIQYTKNLTLRAETLRSSYKN